MSRALVTLAALALVCSAAVPTAAINKTDLMARMPNIANKTELVARMQNVVKPNKTDLLAWVQNAVKAETAGLEEMGKNLIAATKGDTVTKVIACSTGQSSVDNSTIPGTCITTPATVAPALGVTIDLLTVQAVCPAGFQAVGGECAFVPSNTVALIAGVNRTLVATGAFAQGLSTHLRDPTARGGDPAPTGLVTTQFCTGLQNANAVDPELNAIGARVFCAPVKLVKP